MRLGTRMGFLWDLNEIQMGLKWILNGTQIGLD